MAGNVTLSRRDALRLFAGGALHVLLAGGVVGGDYLYTYRTARPLESAGVATAHAASSSGAAPWAAKFRDRFSDTVVSTETSYRDANISVELSHSSVDTGTLDASSGGKHLGYGSSVSYTLADVYVSRIECLQTAFADDTYGVGFEEPLASISARLGSVLAVNGDSYSNNRHKDNGTIIRNGVVYRSAPATDETCVLYRDGTMATYLPEELDPQRLVADGAWQSWVFGPSLLDNGRARTDFYTWSYIRESHPRTAIGYYEPGHYCLLAVDGRQKSSRGMFLEEMAALFERLGCSLAYNLDGGHCTFMTLGTTVVSRPYRPDHKVSDAIMVCPPDTKVTVSQGAGRRSA